MATDDYFDAALALDPISGTVVAGAEAQVYDISDTGFTTPLAITDLTGIAISPLIASPTGIYPPFRVTTGEQSVYAVSGAMVTPLTSKEGSRGVPGADGAPGAPGAGVDPAGSVAGQVLTSAGPDANPTWQPVNGGITGAPTAWPSAFPAELHTHGSGQIVDATTVGRQVMTAQDAQAARAAIGAGTGNGTSNLTLGTSATTAAQGNHSHSASTLPFTPIGSLTATDVQSAIVQAAATGAGGSGTSDTLNVFYKSGAYPTQPSTAPAGVTVRHFYGPTRYMGSTWSGVLDLFTYAELT